MLELILLLFLLWIKFLFGVIMNAYFMLIITKDEIQNITLY
jgi:hypothetical protein